MLHVTHKSCIKWVGAALLAIASLMAVSVSSTANAHKHTQAADLQVSVKVRSAVSCFVLARAQSMHLSVQQVYLKRIGEAKGTAGAVYVLGYTEGTVDAYGHANATRLGSTKKARHDAAVNLYKLMGCTINTRI